MSEREDEKFVSRAEGKLAGAVRAFGFDFRGKVVLDIGSSTGGFTEFALKQGAAKVVAVEKGTRQMKAPLRYDERIDLHEQTDIRLVFSREGLESQKCHSTDKCQGYTFLTFKSEKLAREDHPDVILADVSFISLKPVLVHAREHLAGAQTDFLVMLKPQFEARAEQLVRGVVKNEKMRREIIKDFEAWVRRNGFVIKNKRDNEVVGKSGNRERFYWLKTCTFEMLVVK